MSFCLRVLFSSSESDSWNFSSASRRHATPIAAIVVPAIVGVLVVAIFILCVLHYCGIWTPPCCRETSIETLAADPPEIVEHPVSGTGFRAIRNRMTGEGEEVELTRMA